MAGVAELKAVVGMDNTRYKAGAKGVAQANQGLKQSFKAIGASIAATFSVRAIMTYTKAVIDLGSKLTDLAMQTDLSVETLQAFEFSAIRAGASVEDVRTAVNKLGVNLGKAKDGQKTYIELFERAGVAQEQIANMGTEEAIAAIAKTMDTASTGSKEWGAGLELIGTRSGAKLIEVLKDLNTKGMPEFIKQAKEAGIVMETETAVALDKTADRMALFSRKSKTFFAEFITDAKKVGTALDVVSGGGLLGFVGGLFEDKASREYKAEADIAAEEKAARVKKANAGRQASVDQKNLDDAEQAEFDREVKLGQMRDKIAQDQKQAQDERIKAENAADLAHAEFLDEEIAVAMKIAEIRKEGDKALAEASKGITPLGADLSGIEQMGAAFGGTSIELQQLDRDLQIQEKQAEIMQDTNDKIDVLSESFEKISGNIE